MGKFMTFVTVTSAFAASWFLTTPRFVWGSIALLVLMLIGAKYLSTLWQSANPNEWLLIIQNGKLKKAGVGLKALVWPTQTAVKFPSAIQRIEFSANNVTKEMQGIEVSGFAIWSVNREGDGPFRSYKYTQDGNANGNVQTMCESIVRHQIANHSMQDILTNRNTLRDEMKADLQKQLSGWGIWLETVEITVVRICSYSLFEDLQAEFRQDAHLKAEKIRLQSSLQISQSQQDTETQRVIHDNQQRLKRQTEDTAFYKKQCELESLKIIQAQELDLKKQQLEHDMNIKKLKDKLEIDKINNEFALKKFEEQLKIEKLMTPTNLQKYMIDQTKAIYQGLPLKEIKLNQYIGPEQTGNIASMLPAVGMMMQQNQELMTTQK
ncbi:SPFH_domain/Band 7 family protein [Hexamita inflata]|uniref:SPFH domain/Band 7 family protein n=1 Tax=Hexamita inflata TaxID=28002 RepID=A0AA86P498_9EUKA|nr:SPFH domain/Band 7 family protein [Hexamita inflata]CAI9931972.1 SPFH domain/Band 7 family protein [Hexamita inflata]CAI9969351.1 SPFH domain/Band 7 family protein [Hexamita inflata]